ncbi:hypothetical protein MRB53_041482 [Persea americana]|nr:hypothetical protein MRB53_041482 [Persea americana]
MPCVRPEDRIQCSRSLRLPRSHPCLHVRQDMLSRACVSTAFRCAGDELRPRAIRYGPTIRVMQREMQSYHHSKIPVISMCFDTSLIQSLLADTDFVFLKEENRINSCVRVTSRANACQHQLCARQGSEPGIVTLLV